MNSDAAYVKIILEDWSQRHCLGNRQIRDSIVHSWILGRALAQKTPSLVSQGVKEARGRPYLDLQVFANVAFHTIELTHVVMFPV